MALRTYAEMSTAIQDYCQNSETSFVANIPNFIIGAEDRIFAAVDLPSQWKSQASVLTTANQSEYALTQGVINVLSVRITENVVPAQADPGVEYGPVRYLLQKDYDFLLEAYSGSSTAPSTGVPKYYAISDASTSSLEPSLNIRLGPIPSASLHQMTVTYYGKTSSDSLVNAGTATWLSTVFPDVLLYGSLLNAYIYMKGSSDLIQYYEKQFMEGIMLIKNLIDKGDNGGDFRPRPILIAPNQQVQ